MTAMRLLAASLCVCLLGLAARADEKKSDNAKLIVGKWEVTKGGPDSLPEGTPVEFTKDGKIIIAVKMGDNEVKLEGTYKLKGDKFDIAFKMGDDEHKQTITITKLDKDVMHTEDDRGKVVELKRKK